MDIFGRHNRKPLIGRPLMIRWLDILHISVSYWFNSLGKYRFDLDNISDV